MSVPLAEGKRSLVTEAYDVLKRDIIRCALVPGQQVSEGLLEERYQIGRSAIRVALNRLLQERLVTVLPHQGYVITPVTLKRVRDLYDFRGILDGAAMRLAAGRIDVPELRRLANEFTRYQRRLLDDPSDGEVMTELFDINKRFHLAIARATGNEVLEESMASLLDQMDRIIHLSHLLAGSNGYDADQDVHLEIVDVLASGDAGRAAALSEELLAGAKKKIIEALVASPNLDEVNLAVQQSGGD
jgi:DNA-binding GntR family transcriptional regulator